MLYRIEWWENYALPTAPEVLSTYEQSWEDCTILDDLDEPYASGRYGVLLTYPIMYRNREFFIKQYNADREEQRKNKGAVSGPLTVPDWLQRERALFHVTGDWQTVPDDETEAEVCRDYDSSYIILQVRKIQALIMSNRCTVLPPYAHKK